MKKKIVWVGIAVAIVITLIFFLYPRNLKHIFTKNTENAEIMANDHAIRQVHQIGNRTVFK